VTEDVTDSELWDEADYVPLPRRQLSGWLALVCLLTAYLIAFIGFNVRDLGVQLYLLLPIYALIITAAGIAGYRIGASVADHWAIGWQAGLAVGLLTAGLTFELAGLGELWLHGGIITIGVLQVVLASGSRLSSTLFLALGITGLVLRMIEWPLAW